MLTAIREKLKGWVAYFIIGLITIPFALFGINQYFAGEKNIIVASVGDLEINKAEYLKQYNRQKQRLEEQLGDKYSNEIDRRLKNKALNTLISQYLVQNQVNKFNFLTTNSELQKSLLQQGAFKEDGVFSFEKYKQILTLNGYSIARFEEEEKQRLASRQLSQGLFNSSFIDKKQLTLFLKIKNQLRKFDYFSIDAKNYLKEVTVDEASIEDIYEKNKHQFVEEEKVKVSFVSLEAKDLAKNIKVNEKKLLSLYEDEKERFSTLEEREVAHILFEDKAKAQSILTKLKDKPSLFAKLAKENSIDDDSAPKGGNLGFFTQGVMEKSFDETLFNLQKGDISEVIETESGFHIIKLLRIKKSKVKSFISVKNELETLFREQKALAKLNSLREEFSALTYDNPDSLKEVAKGLNLKIKVTDWISKRGIVGKNKEKTLFNNPKFIKAAFSAEVLISKENSNVIDISENQLVVMRIKKHQNKRQKLLKEVHEIIKTQIAKVLAITYIKKLGANIVDAFPDKSKLNNLLKENNLAWKSSDLVNRINEDIDTNVLNIAFQTHKKIGSYKGALVNGRYIFVVLKGFKDTKITEEDKTLYLSNLLSIENEVKYLNILKNFQNKIKIEVFSRNL
jgi:peptidyl-prolyl cis-trans isomerase D